MNIKKNLKVNCSHFDRCSGCKVEKDVSNFPLFGEVAAFFAKHGFPSIQLQVGNAIAWRYRAKLAVRGTTTNPQIGLYEEGTHHVINIPECQVQHPSINAAVNILQEWIKQFAVPPYNETLESGCLRYIQLTIEPDTEKVQLVLVLNGEASLLSGLKESIKSLWDQKENFWHSLWINFNSRRDNIIFGDEWKLIYGEPYLWASFCGQSVCYHPASFFQANPVMFEKLLKSLQQDVPRGAIVAEFYAGVGAIGLTLAEIANEIRCSEVVPLAKECFDRAVLQLPESLRGRFSYHVGSAKTSLDLLTEEIDTVIVDPPRKGLDSALLKSINNHLSLKKFIYVSCGFDSFVRDFDELIAAKWELKKVEVFLFFPGTEHVEILAVFNR